MGFLKKQAARLMREKWPNAQLLAEELIAMFNSEEPIELDGPVIINNNSTEPAITINQGGASNISIQIKNSPVPFPKYDIPPIDFADIVNVYTTNIYNNGSVESPQKKDDEESGKAYAAVVTGGSGDTYEVSVYKNGLTLAPVTATAKQLQIHPTETIPAGTWTIVVQSDGGYYMQVPVWL